MNSPPSFLTDSKQIQLPEYPKLVVFTCSYQLEHYSDNLFDGFKIAFPEQLQQAVPKRRAEHLAGRYVAKQALSTVGINTSISIGEDRAPIWPDNITGSITHTTKDAYTALGKTGDFLYVGIDLEEWLSPTTAQDIQQIIATESEMIWIKRSPLTEQIQLLTLIFSAKESLFKALYPEVREHFDFHDARVLEITEKSVNGVGEFYIELIKTLSPNLLDQMVFKGNYYKQTKQVLTVIAR